MGILKVIGPKDNYRGEYIDTTSKAAGWSKELSPFYLGPVELYNGYKSNNVENAWQFAKVYSIHADENGNATQNYYDWAINGWNSVRAIRYPMGKGAIPLYTLWGDKKYGYIDARKHVYVPLYAKAVIKTQAFQHIKHMYESGQSVVLWDYDGYSHDSLGMDIDEVLNCERKKMGHSFVIYMLLTGKVIVQGNTVYYT